ncbi:hypothetical protein B9T31_08335 [Acinetobacter sp. ANC 4558]|uniref:tripartite tricarboxylate transporter TctB family protein n=1 Tax=Acinetobacter sp. ANC 4558 TaxID=1977876 RepID=UPI000A355CD0|nr:tripartite tricarboxylate transporter TctB family protein [Acinetobacter sp. ANC 4558]OTG86486.1 hypothetical protein B9T31_08335 [Acinetobacter sp. ANC 4558]
MLIERIFSGCLVIASLFLLYIAWSLVAPIAYDPLGPRPYPILLLSLIAASCLYLVLRPQFLAEKIHLGFSPLILKKVGLTLLFFFLYAIGFEYLGFPIATALMACFVGILFGGSVKASTISGILLGILCYFLFDYLLDVPLPLGLLNQ